MAIDREKVEAGPCSQRKFDLPAPTSISVASLSRSTSTPVQRRELLEEEQILTADTPLTAHFPPSSTLAAGPSTTFSTTVNEPASHRAAERQKESRSPVRGRETSSSQRQASYSNVEEPSEGTGEGRSERDSRNARKLHPKFPWIRDPDSGSSGLQDQILPESSAVNRFEVQTLQIKSRK